MRSTSPLAKWKGLRIGMLYGTASTRSMITERPLSANRGSLSPWNGTNRATKREVSSARHATESSVVGASPTGGTQSRKD